MKGVNNELINTKSDISLSPKIIDKNVNPNTIDNSTTKIPSANSPLIYYSQKWREYQYVKSSPSKWTIEEVIISILKVYRIIFLQKS